MQRKWILRLITALLWALAAASAVYWGLRLAGPGTTRVVPSTAQAVPAGDASARQAAIARILADAHAATNSPVALAPNRFSLLGVVAQGSGGAALLVVDGKPARPYRVGSQIDEGLLLQSVGPRHVVLAASATGPALQRLELPGPMAAAAAAPPASAQVPQVPQATPPAPAAPVPAAQNLQRLRSSWHPEQPRWSASSAAARLA